MYFYYDKGKQHVDLQGDLVITHNKNLVMARAKSAAPKVHNVSYVVLPGLGIWRKIKATLLVVGFIWGEVPPITNWAPDDNVLPFHKRSGRGGV